MAAETQSAVVDLPVAPSAPPGPLHAAPRAADPWSATSRAHARFRTSKLFLAIADVAAALTALYLCLDVLGHDRLPELTTVATIPLVIGASKIIGLYDRDDLLVRKTTLDEAPGLFQLATLYTLVLGIVDRQVIEGELGADQLLGLWVSMFLFALFARTVARSLARASVDPERCLFIGDADSYQRVESKFAGMNATLVGRLSLRRTGRSAERATSEWELRDLLGWTKAERLIIDPETLQQQDMLKLVRAAKATGVPISLLPRVLDVVGSSIAVDDLHGVTLLGVPRFGLSRSSLLLKRVFDIAGATIALVVVAPLLLAIAVAIRIDGGGPVLFGQTRVGRGGRTFRMCKFRTMIDGAEAQKEALRERNEAPDGLFKIEDDPRITRVGRLLRRTSLDELPQLLNVVAGSMSLVGPRPLVVDEDERIVGGDRDRLQLTPGMTGPWQILGSSRVPMSEMVKLDYLYVGSWSLFGDVKILLRTVPLMLARRGL